MLRNVQPAAVLRRVAKLDAARQFPGPGRLERCVEGSLRMRVEVVEHQDDLVAVGVAPCQQASDLASPVRFRPPLAGGRLPPARQGVAEQEDRRRAGPFVLVIHAPGTVLRRRDRRAGFLDQLHGLLVHARHRALRVKATLVGFQDLFHARREFGVGLGGGSPSMGPRAPICRFLSVRLIVSWLIDGTISSATTRRASNRSDQFAQPSVAARGVGANPRLLLAVEQLRHRRRRAPLACQR